jgi:hypothetical protein
MQGLILGVILGMAGIGLAAWARARNLSVRWYAWVLFGLGLLMAVLTAMDYISLTKALEPEAADVILWLFGGPALFLALLAVAIVWWHNRKNVRVPTRR